LLTESDVSDILQNTVENFWYGLKDKRSSWVNTILEIANKKGLNNDQLYATMNEFCIARSCKQKDDETYMPKLWQIVKYITGKTVGGKFCSDATAAWATVPDCELCYNGFVGYVDWSYFEEPMKTYRCFSAYCNCKKGMENPHRAEPIKRLTLDELLEKIASGGKYTIVKREDMVKVDAKDLPTAQQVRDKVNEEYMRVIGIPF
jgi:hypothetical protein